jgi:hypothetical protein
MISKIKRLLLDLPLVRDITTIVNRISIVDATNSAPLMIVLIVKSQSLLIMKL